MDSRTTGHLEDCINICHDNPLCEWYTLEKAIDSCMLYENCNSTFGCETCATGERSCSNGYVTHTNLHAIDNEQDFYDYDDYDNDYSEEYYESDEYDSDKNSTGDYEEYDESEEYESDEYDNAGNKSSRFYFNDDDEYDNYVNYDSDSYEYEDDDYSDEDYSDDDYSDVNALNDANDADHENSLDDPDEY